MFCSWRKSPAAPCACAYVLRSPVSEVLHHLCHLGQGTLVHRERGLSLAKITPFGLAVAERESGWNLLRDRVSGLETDTSRPRNIYLMTDAADRRPLLAMGGPDQPIDLSIRLDGHTWESPVVTALLRKFDGVSLDCRESRRLGAGAWLDDWGDVPPSTCDGELVREAGKMLRDCGWLEVDVQGGTHRSVARFQPSFVDSEGRVLRVADRACRHVVYADAEAAGFRLVRTHDGGIRMFREPNISDSAA